MEQFLGFFPQVKRGHSKGIFLYKWIGRRNIQTELAALHAAGHCIHIGQIIVFQRFIVF